MRQTRILTKLELCNLYGINTIRHMKNPEQKRKTKIFVGIIVFLFLVMLSYIVALCAGLGMLGAANVIPAYLIAISSFFILFFDVFKIGGVIFRKQGYDIISALPISDGAIVVSRFLRMYVESLIVAMFVFVPGIIVYAVYEPSAPLVWCAAAIVIVFTPLLPLAVATLIGTFITGIASRMKHKALAEAVISLAVVMGVLGLSMNVPGSEEELSLAMLSRFSELATKALQDTYPPAIYLGKAVTEGDVVKCLLPALCSVAVVAVVMWIAKINFHTICRNLYLVRAKHDYQLGRLQMSSVKKAVLVREVKRYFASGPYVSNTIIGPALGAATGVALLMVDTDAFIAQMTSQIPMPLNVKGGIPLFVAAVMAMMNAVCMSVSMEGKAWWIVKSLPLDTKTILDGKLFFNLLLIAPFFVVGQICLMIALRPGIVEGIAVVLLAALLVMFSCIFGLWINLLFPKLDWENETAAVKQSAASMLGGMGGVLVTILFAMPVLLLPSGYFLPVCVVESVILILWTRRLYEKNNRMALERI